MSHPLKYITDNYLLGRKLVALDEWPRPNEPTDGDIAIQRLDWSIKWHTLAHLHARRWYTWLKGIQIVASAAIPVLSISGGSSFTVRVWVAILGALVVVLEGIQQLKKYAQNAILWGQGKEALKREYYLFSGEVPPYDKRNRLKLLSERIEQLVGHEVGKWAETHAETQPQSQPPKPQSKPQSKRQSKPQLEMGTQPPAQTAAVDPDSEREGQG